MLRHFNDQASWPTRAVQVWQILVGAAMNRQTLTYGRLAELLHFEGAGTLGGVLGHINYLCRENDLPSLTALVVKHDTGVSGEGLLEQNPDVARERIYSLDWYGMVPPTAEEFKTAFDRGQKGRSGPAT